MNKSLDALIKRHGTVYHVTVKAVSSSLEDIMWYTGSLNGQMVFMSRITISSKTGQTKSLRNGIKI